MVDALDDRVFRRCGGVDGIHDRQTRGEDVVGAGAVEGQTDVVEVDHRVEVPTERDRVRHLAEPLDVDGGVKALGETCNIFQGDRNRVSVTDFHVSYDKPRGCVEPD